MSLPKPSREKLEEAVSTYLREQTMSGGARAMDVPRSTFRDWMKCAEEEGLINLPQTAPNPASVRLWEDIVGSHKAAHVRKRAKGNWRKPVMISMPENRPIILTALGDPHLGNDGTDLELWERWTIHHLSRADGIHGLAMGDWLDNWRGYLAYLYGEDSTSAPDQWHLLEGYLDRLSGDILASCSGNHDDWSGYSDVLGMLMRRIGAAHRHGAIRVALSFPDRDEPFTVGMRHKFRGNSIHNPAHGVMSGARTGWRDNILLSAHVHRSGGQPVKDPETGHITHAYQIAAFKLIDNYVDTHGFRDEHLAPAMAFVVDPRRGNADPALITGFYDPEAATEYVYALRGRLLEI